MTPITDLIAGDRALIPYRPLLNKITNAPLSSILLAQILYWSKSKDYKPFFKFRKPCDHNLYTDGDSWTEELGFSPAEFDTALKRIGQKLKKGTAKDPEALVWFWTDMSRVTWYEANRQYIEIRLSGITSSAPEKEAKKPDANSGIKNTEIAQTATTQIPESDTSKLAKDELYITETTTENTKNTTEKEEALALPSNPDQSQIKNENQEPQPENKTAEQPEKETPQIAAAPLIEDVEVEDLFTEPKTDEIDPAQIIVDKIMKAPRVKKEMWYVRHGVNGDLSDRAYEYATFYISKYCMEMPDDSLIPYLKNANSNALQSGFETSWLRNLKRYAPKPEEMTAEELRKKRDYDLEQYCIKNGIE